MLTIVADSDIRSVTEPEDSNGLAHRSMPSKISPERSSRCTFNLIFSKCILENVYFGSD
jgi:hypothetical protein